FVRVTQSLIPIGLILGTVSLLAACIAFTSRKVFNASALFAALFSFLCFAFVIIGVTVFATESLAFTERFHTNSNSRRYGMWLMIPCLIFSFIAALCFVVAAILNWYDYRSMKVTGILNHSADKFGSVLKTPSDSNMTALKHQQQQLVQAKPLMLPHQYPDTCYQPGALPSYPPPSYVPQLNGAINPAFHRGLYGYSRPPSPNANLMFNLDLNHHRHYMTENSDLEEIPKINRSRKRSRSRRHSTHRSRSHSPRENNNNGNNHNRPQYIPIPIPYYQPQQQQAQSSHNTTAQQQQPPMPYVIQASNQKQPTQYIEEIAQTIPQSRILTEAKGNVLTYPALTNGPLLMNGNPIQLTNCGQTQQPVYAISYRTNNSSMIPSNGQQIAITTGPPATPYVTTAVNPSRGMYAYSQTNTEQIIEITSEDEENTIQQTQQQVGVPARRRDQNKSINEAWTWRKL
ncbi:unnamed protein product, partial [Didymodactylos carnosus]